ncbi:hypothetical protein ACF08W_34565 [Streptomyces sp. NPDC015144]|uniref:hypothetical protein n=1 Tax=Streptomyces sp. NPDC015144 TaxID=3364944 RepID=UPI003700430E
MSVTVTKTSGRTAQITWTADDDLQGYLDRAVESDQLADALQSLGQPVLHGTPDQILTQAQHTATLARLLERRAASQVVQLRDIHGLSWRKIAAAILDAPEKQSSVRRMYESGRRQSGSITGGTYGGENRGIEGGTFHGDVHMPATDQ